MEIDGEPYVLDPTQGFVGRRCNMTPGRHVPILGMPNVLRGIREYTERNGDAAINSYYDYMLAVIQEEDSRVASR